MIKFSVTKNGEVVDPRKYDWNEETKTFSSFEDGLVLDFSGIEGVTFNTSDYCTFNTGDYCTFKTGCDCTFNTGSHCIFNTGSHCIFKTGCDCTFKTGDSCTFDTSCSCTFDTGEKCVVIRRDIFEIIQLVSEQKIKLNDYNIPGYEIVQEETKEELLEKLVEKLKNLSVEELKKFIQ